MGKIYVLRYAEIYRSGIKLNVSWLNFPVTIFDCDGCSDGVMPAQSFKLGILKEYYLSALPIYLRGVRASTGITYVINDSDVLFNLPQIECPTTGDTTLFLTLEYEMIGQFNIYVHNVNRDTADNRYGNVSCNGTRVRYAFNLAGTPSKYYTFTFEETSIGQFERWEWYALKGYGWLYGDVPSQTQISVSGNSVTVTNPLCDLVLVPHAKLKDGSLVSFPVYDKSSVGAGVDEVTSGTGTIYRDGDGEAVVMTEIRYYTGDTDPANANTKPMTLVVIPEGSRTSIPVNYKALAEAAIDSADLGRIERIEVTLTRADPSINYTHSEKWECPAKGEPVWKLVYGIKGSPDTEGPVQSSGSLPTPPTTTTVTIPLTITGPNGRPAHLQYPILKYSDYFKSYIPAISPNNTAIGAETCIVTIDAIGATPGPGSMDGVVLIVYAEYWEETS